jgi:arylsulfatase A-like enzyme
MSAMRRFVVFVFSVCTAAFAFLGCRPASAPDPALPSPNIILVMVDTLRADHMSLYDYQRPTTPFIDSFASDAIVFERARSQAACTFPSVNSLFTSRYAFDYYRLGKGQMGIPAEYPTMAEILRARGYSTVAVSASPIVRATPSKENPNGGFGAGFDVFDETCLWNNARCVNKRALEIVNLLEEPFFLYLHYMDPHAHYSPPKSYTRKFAGAYEGHEFIAAGQITPIAEMLFADGPKVEITERDIQHLVDLYNDEIRYFDGQLNKLFTNWRDDGLIDRSITVITSDHGEELMEHNQVGHCRGVWDTLTRVPLIIRYPENEAGQKINAPVQLVDVVPTLLDLLDIEFPGFAAEGVSLVGVIGGEPPQRQYAYCDQSRFRSTDDGRWQLILNGEASTATLFNLPSDPLAQRDLFSGSHPEVERLSSALNLWLEETGQMLNFDAALAASKAKEEELRALGYLQ